MGGSNVHVWPDRLGGIIARGFRNGDDYWMTWPRVAAYRFSAGDPFITAFPSGDVHADIVRDIYTRSVLPFALQALGWEALHASAIVAESGVIAFCAVSETGKSTTAFALRQRGFPQWADDGVVLQISEGVSTIPLPFEARLRPASRDLFPARSSRTSAFSGEGAGEQQYRDPLPLSAICLLNRIAGPPGTPPQVSRLKPAPAFPALLVHAHEFDPGDSDRRARMMRAYLDLVAEVPVYEVSFVPNRARVESLCDAIVEGVQLRIPADVASVSRS